jgi:apolipoprotein N-acyltransferase
VVTSRWAALGLAVLAGALHALGYVNPQAWPLAFVSLVPLLLALRGRRGGRAFLLGWLTGTAANAVGFYWITSMLRTFSGFPAVACDLLGVLLFAAQGSQFGFFGWFVARADRAGVPRLIAVPAIFAALELAFPLLFPSYIANVLHDVPVLIQFADVGGVLLVGAALTATATAIEQVIAAPYLSAPDAAAPPADDTDRVAPADPHTRTRTRTRTPTRTRLRPLVVPAAIWLAAIPYGFYRIAEVDRENRTAPSLRVGVVQENLGLLEKRNEPELALYRHFEATHRLEAQGVDLVVWSESAVAFFIPSDARDVRDALDPWTVHVPVLFGALASRGGRYYNTAFMVDRTGDIVGTYDKTYLLAFGEYIPGGETFPRLYRMSRNTGHFTAGSRLAAVPLPGDGPGHPRTVLPLICYEDILPRFVRTFQRAADASLFAVILNDAWFGDTAEPWIHFGLSKFRSIEHRRDFVRAANSGVSGFIDAAGRVIAHTGTFTPAAPVARVHLRTRHTVYYYLGDWAGWLGVAVALWAIRPRRRTAKAPAPAPTA